MLLLQPILHREPPLSRANSCSNSSKPELIEIIFRPQVDHFAQYLLEDKDSSINFADGFKTHQVMFAIEESLAEGRPVRMEEMDQ